MEILFQDNKLFIFFWIMLSLIISNRNDTNNHVIVIATYIIAYLVSIIDAIKTLFALSVVLIILFLHFEILVDEFKTKILNIFEMLIDFLYLMIFEYGFFYFLFSMFLSTNFVFNNINISYYFMILISSFILLYGCIIISKREFKLKSFSLMKKEMDNIKGYRDFLSSEKVINNYECILLIEDRNFFRRKNNYTYLGPYFLKFRYLRKILYYLKSIVLNENRRERIHHSLRGYSTIEMQTIRTLAIEDGYFHYLKRKIYELIYPYLYFYPLKRYYKKCECDNTYFKEYILYIYMNIAPVLINGGKEKLEKCFEKKILNINDYTKEELFLLTLTFSGKIKRDSVFEIYSDIIEELGLNLAILNEKKEKLLENTK